MVENKLGKMAAFALTAATLLEGCSPSISPIPAASDILTSSQSQDIASESPIPLEPVNILLIDCQEDPNDSTEEDGSSRDYTLKKGQVQALGAKTIQGLTDIVHIVSQGEANAPFIIEKQRFNIIKQDLDSNTKTYTDNNFSISLEWEDSGKDTKITVDASCNTPVDPSPSQNLDSSIDFLVNCVSGPFSNEGKVYELKKDDKRKVGGIIKQNNQEYLEFSVTKDWELKTQPHIPGETHKAIYPPSFEYSDENLDFLFDGSKIGNKFELTVSEKCITLLGQG